MARTDAVQFFLELAAEWRRLGAEVTFEPGWERRGNGQSARYEGGIVHHTASFSSFTNPFPTRSLLINGRSDLPGPIANVGGPVCPVDRPRLHIIAAHPANHAGASGGRSMGPLPVTRLFNPTVVGLEIDYAGLTPMIGGQYKAALIFTRGLANVLRRSVEYIRAHAETSVTGKWDPGYANGRTLDMAVFRRDAANLTPGSLEDDMPNFGDTIEFINPDTKQKVTFSFAQWLTYANFYAGKAAAQAAANGTQIAALTAAVTALANSNDEVDTATVLAHITAEVEKAQAELRKTLSEGYELRLEPRTDG
jgi:hypothetical protein